MRITQLAKDGSSGETGCPAVYIAEDGTLVVQGQHADADTFGNLNNVLAGEGAVHIDLQVVKQAIARYEGSA